jgi:hypothetical protein
VDYIGVFWVEWREEEGFAERRAVGHIREDIWEELEREDVHLVLG